MSSYQRKGQSLHIEDLVEFPLISHAQCIHSSPNVMERALNCFVSDPQVGTLSDERESHRGFLSRLDGSDVVVGYLAFGEPVTVRLWNQDCFHCVLPYRGRARMEQYPKALQGANGPFFLLPKSDQQWQLSEDCELLFLRVDVETEARGHLTEALRHPWDPSGRTECARVMMESLPYRLHHGMNHTDKLSLLNEIRKEFMQLFGFYPEKRGWVEGPQVTDPRVLRAMDYLVQLPASGYSLDAVCEVAHMSARGLYYAFERNLGCTPYAYFRACHLVRVRLSLLEDPERRYSIAWHASAHGFRHMSRFASHYRNHFGELPSETCHRLEQEFHCLS